ncbi:Lymphoid-specific helicase [Wickerhamomyces ciferrii]|uniref:Lymphoid-specific helicase n=1 Tax=Wickerhamomyces ciferrii (strain ATCC 14091 / BCRC 22168 / CBS 111 / JCM 3599 / NBRC 0793 / NRRL Y-1031 F-60-10) TaxID=1206466 RepID=K0KH11_WICCF|nr:Lymphoid-specific helicase [Wickerhamomyces ciferrii]CCH40674.1 Lymphoid-specific helicase [Wickerhamomyces ciferrii]
MTVEEQIKAEDEDQVVNQIIEEGEKTELKDDKELMDFNELSVDFKLERLQNLVKQSQVFSSIISDTLLENSLSKRKAREEEKVKQETNDVRVHDEPPKKKSKRGRKSSKEAKNQSQILDFYSTSVSDETKLTKSKLEQSQSNNNSTIKQPSLVSGTEMRDYQLEGTEWLITLYENGLNGILADEMGLGKTIQSIALLAFLYEQGIKGPFLITAPLSTVGNWVKEFARFAPSLPVLGYVGLKDDRKLLREDNFQNCSIIVTSYEIVLRDLEFLNKINWKFLIVDEGHRLKNLNCKLIKNLKKLKTSNRLLITGTPLQNNLNELWSLLNFILPDIFHDLELFQKWFDFSSLNSLQQNVKDDQTKKLIDSKIQESLVNNLHTILKPFLLRRLKKDVIKNLPPKREYIVYGSLTSKQSELYKHALFKSLKKSILKFALEEHIGVNNLKLTKEEIDGFLFTKMDSSYLESQDEITADDRLLRSEKQELLKLKTSKTKLTKNDKLLQKSWNLVNKWVDTKNLQNLLMQLRQICLSTHLFYFPWEDESYIDLERLLSNSSKLQILDQLLPKLLNKGHKVLIFSQFTKMLDLIEDYLELKNLQVSRLDGSVSQEDREIEIQNFNNNEEVKIFLLSTRAGGLGLNLTKADSVIIFDSDWNPQVDLQAMDRVHRIGQTKPIVVYRLVIKNTIEQIILAKADSKRKLEKLVIQLGKFESLKKLMKHDNQYTFSQKKETNKEENQLAQELAALLDDNRFKDSGYTINDSKLSELELNELLDRSDEAYNRGIEYYQDEKFKHIQIFETTATFT